MISFRPADLTTDAPWLAHLLSLTTTEPVTVEQVRKRWQPAEGETRFTHVALNDEGQIVGLADVGHEAWLKPGHVRLTLIVAPEWRKQGLGSQLFAESLRFAQAQGASQVESAVRENAAEALGFAQQRGYRVDRHSFESALDLTSFDERPFVSALERARAAGLRFFSLADLAPVTEQLERRLYDLNRVTGLDNPGNDGFFSPYEEFRTFVFEAAWFRADGQILAADGEQWIGLAAVAFYPEAHYAYNAFTGVERGYRGQGLACALKLLAIRWAQQVGARTMRTNNDSRNAPMLAINRKLGYRPEPGIYHMVLDLG